MQLRGLTHPRTSVHLNAKSITEIAGRVSCVRASSMWFLSLIPLVYGRGRSSAKKCRTLFKRLLRVVKNNEGLQRTTPLHRQAAKSRNMATKTTQIMCPFYYLDD